MKRALVELHSNLLEDGWIHGEDFWYIVNSHDEFQIEVTKDVDIMGKTMCLAMTEAGKRYNLKVEITGEWKQGRCWKDTH